MELNREQIVKALECCENQGVECRKCPLIHTKARCYSEIKKLALSLIKELTVENEMLKVCKKELVNKNAELKYKLNEEITEDDIDLYYDKLLQLHIEGIKEAKANTLRDIQTKFAIRFGTYTPDDVVNITEVFSLLAKIEKEILQ